MKLLKTINPDSIAVEQTTMWKYRETSRAVIVDNDGNIALMHVSYKDYYKLPGGGIEVNEDMYAAVHRECKEEAGVTIEIIQEIGRIIEFQSYKNLHQTSYCFLAQVTSEKMLPIFTNEELELGLKIVWLPPEKALELLAKNTIIAYEGGFITERDYTFLQVGMTYLH